MLKKNELHFLAVDVTLPSENAGHKSTQKQGNMPEYVDPFESAETTKEFSVSELIDELCKKPKRGSTSKDHGGF